jgi:hypothetical protein
MIAVFSVVLNTVLLDVVHPRGVSSQGEKIVLPRSIKNFNPPVI